MNQKELNEKRSKLEEQIRAMESQDRQNANSPMSLPTELLIKLIEGNRSPSFELLIQRRKPRYKAETRV